jgi:hypothetical protein
MTTLFEHPLTETIMPVMAQEPTDEQLRELIDFGIETCHEERQQIGLRTLGNIVRRRDPMPRTREIAGVLDRAAPCGAPWMRYLVEM